MGKGLGRGFQIFKGESCLSGLWKGLERFLIVGRGLKQNNIVFVLELESKVGLRALVLKGWSYTAV